jgi:hypothetical protein
LPPEPRMLAIIHGFFLENLARSTDATEKATRSLGSEGAKKSADAVMKMVPADLLDLLPLPAWHSKKPLIGSEIHFGKTVWRRVVFWARSCRSLSRNCAKWSGLAVRSCAAS